MERIDRIEKAIEELVAAQKKTDAQLAKTDAQLAKTDAQLAKTDQQIAELREAIKEVTVQIKETNQQIGGISNTNGEFAENFFFSSLSQKMQLGNIRFDHIERNLKGRLRNLTDEFDIVLFNGDSIGLLEIKNTVKAAHVKQLISSKLQNFRALNPEYAKAKIYLGVGGFTFENHAVKASAKTEGIAVLEVQGEHFQVDTELMRAF
jgi:chromosome segregation ATPase